MNYPWFRMYSEFITDPLIRMLSFEDQRHFVAALCLKASGVLDKQYPSPEVRRAVISQLIGLNADEGERNALDAANARLRKLGLIDEQWQPRNWEKRQFISDHSDPTAAERMRRYRNKNRNVTPVTPVVTALDSDTESEKNKKGADAPVVLHESLPRDAGEEWLAHRREKRLTMSPRALNKQLKLLARYETAIQREMIDISINAGWEGIFAPKGAQPQEEQRRGLPTLRV